MRHTWKTAGVVALTFNSFGLKPIGMARPGRELPPLVEELLAKAVDSFEKLEIVLYLHGAPGVSTTAEIAGAIGIRRDMTSEALRELARSGVVTKDDATWFLARHGPWRDHLGPLVSSAAADRTDVFRFLSAQAMDRVRSEAARVFADAFILRPKKPRSEE